MLSIPAIVWAAFVFGEIVDGDRHRKGHA
jgi:hypothetical protein